MAITREQLEFKIGADSSDLVKSLDNVKKSTRETESESAKLDSTIKTLSKTEMEYALAIDRASKSSIQKTDSLDELEKSSRNLNDSINTTSSSMAGMQLSSDQIKEFEASVNKVDSTVSRLNTTLIQSRNAAGQFTEGFGDAGKNIEKTGGLFSSIISLIGHSLAIFAAMVAGFSGIQLFKGWMASGISFTNIIKGIGPAFASAISGLKSFNIANIFNGIGPAVSSAFGSIKDIVGTAAASFKNLNLSIADVYKILSLGGLALGTLADTLSGSTVGSLELAAALGTGSAAFLAISIAIKVALHSLGSFIEGIGDSLNSAMSGFEEKFAKSQQIVTQFGFVIKNFGAAYGPGFVGTLSEWEAKIESLAKTSTISSNDIRKATKIVVAENQALGLSYEENVKFLERSVDIAASSGLELVDVVQRLQSALMGNSTAVGALGINLSSHAIEHSKLNQVMQKTIGTMTSQEKLQISLAEIYRQTEPLVGAAIKQGETIIGINQEISNSYGSIQSKLGSVGVLSLALKSTYAELLKSVEGLPDTFYNIVSSMIDLFGVTFKVIGVTLQWMILIGGLHTAYKLLNIALITNAALQNTLNVVFSKLGLNIGVQTASIVNMATLFKALTAVLKGGFLVIMANVGHVIQIVAGKVLTLTTAILTNPLFLTGVGIAVGIFALIKAMDELNKEFGIIQLTIGDFSDTFAVLKGVMGGAEGVISGSFNTLVQSIKISILSVAELIQYLVIAGSAIGKLFDPSNTDEYNKSIDDSLQKLDTLTASHEKSLDSIAMGFVGANEKISLHAKFLDAAGKATEELAFKQLQLKKAADAIDINTIRIDILGTEVQKITNKYMVATKEAAKFRKEILDSTEVNTEAIKSYQKALEDQAAAGFQLDKVRKDSLKGMADIIKELKKDSLKADEDEKKGIIAGFNDRRDAVKEFEKALANLGPVSTDSAIKIKEAYKAIDIAQKISLRNAQKKREDEAIAETIKVYKEEAEALKIIAERNREISKSIAGERLTAQQKIMSDLAIELSVLDERLFLERASRGNNSEIVKALELQKILLVQNAEVQKRMADMELPDWIDQLGVALKNAFAFEAAKNFFAFIGDQITKINESELVINIKEKISKTTENIGIGDGGAISKAMSSVGDGIMKAGKVAYAAGGALISAATTIGGFVGGFIDVIMNADKYLKVLIEFPKQFLQVIKNLPGLVKQFIDEFPGMIRAIAEALPTILIKLVDQIPSFIAAFIDAIPLLIERLAEALPEIFIKIIGMIPKIAVMLARGFFLALQGFIKGLIRGLGRLFSGLKMPKVNLDTTETQKQFKKLAGTAGRLFSVKDLVEGVKDPMDQVMESIKEGFRKGSNLIRDAWQWVMDKIITPLLDGIMSVWTFVRDKILMPIWNALRSAVASAWQFVKNLWDGLGTVVASAWSMVVALWNTLASVVTAAFQFVSDLWNSLGAIVSNAFGWIVTNVITPLSSIGEKIAAPISAAFEGIALLLDRWVIQPLKSIGDYFVNIISTMGEKVIAAFSSVFMFFEDLGKYILKAFQPIFDFFGNIGQNIVDGIKKAASGGGIQIGGEVGKAAETIKNVFKFSEGGSVPLYAASGLMIPKGTDTVPAMLTPGEFVMSKRGVNTAGLGMLQGINSGQMPTAGNTYNIQFEINVEAKTTMDEGFIRQQLIPKMRENLKRASLDGEFVLSSKGVRA